MKAVGIINYAQLRAASLFVPEKRKSLSISGIWIDQRGFIEATDHKALISIRSTSAKGIAESCLIRPQGWFGATCESVILYQTEGGGNVGFMQGLTSSGNIIQHGGFDHSIPVLFIDATFPSTKRIKRRRDFHMSTDAVLLDASIVARVGKAVNLLTGNRTSQVKMQFFHSPNSIIVSDTAGNFCDVYFNQVNDPNRAGGDWPVRLP